VGFVDRGDGILGDDLRHRVPEHLRPRVAWAGFLDGEESALAYHAADVLAVPSDMEPWGLVVQEPWRLAWWLSPATS